MMESEKKESFGITAQPVISPIRRQTLVQCTIYFSPYYVGFRFDDFTLLSTVPLNSLPQVIGAVW
jgi:hypothetical protein